MERNGKGGIIHLIERYSLSCGVKIGEPYIYDKFFPLTSDKYITIHTSSRQAKNYDYWQEVIDILLPILQKVGISIVQVGSKDDKLLNFVYQTVGQTNINQVAYIVRHAALHLGTDSFPVHLASFYDIPIVALYANTYAACSRPYWGTKTKQVILEPDRKNRKPSFSFDENPKTINSIYPEVIAKKVCDLLGLNFTYEYKTLFIGQNFGSILVEIIPNSTFPMVNINTDTMIIRMDFHFDESVLSNYLNSSKCVIVTNRPISPQVLVQFKERIVEIHYNITKEHNPQFVYFLQTLGIKCSIHTYLPEAEIDKLKLDYMDFGIIVRLPSEIPEAIINKENLYYKSSKFTFHTNQVFPSYYAFLQNLPIGGVCNHLCPVPSLESKYYGDFWKEQRHIRIVEKV